MSNSLNEVVMQLMTKPMHEEDCNPRIAEQDVGCFLAGSCQSKHHTMSNLIFEVKKPVWPIRQILLRNCMTEEAELSSGNFDVSSSLNCCDSVRWENQLAHNER